jgi:hypothetical protein
MERFCIKLLVPAENCADGSWAYDPVIKTIKPENLRGKCLHGSCVENFYFSGGYQQV